MVKLASSKRAADGGPCSSSDDQSRPAKRTKPCTSRGGAIRTSPPTTTLCALNMSHFREMVHQFTGTPTHQPPLPHHRGPSSDLFAPPRLINDLIHPSHPPQGPSVLDAISSCLLQHGSSLQAYMTIQSEINRIFGRSDHALPHIISSTSNASPPTSYPSPKTAYSNFVCASTDSLLQMQDAAILSSMVNPTLPSPHTHMAYARETHLQTPSNDVNCSPIDIAYTMEAHFQATSKAFDFSFLPFSNVDLC